MRILENEVSKNFKPPKLLTLCCSHPQPSSLVLSKIHGASTLFPTLMSHATHTPPCASHLGLHGSRHPPAYLTLSFLMVDPTRKIQSCYLKRIIALAPKRRPSFPDPYLYKRVFCCRLRIEGAERPNAYYFKDIPTVIVFIKPLCIISLDVSQGNNIKMHENSAGD